MLMIMNKTMTLMVYVLLIVLANILVGSCTTSRETVSERATANVAADSVTVRTLDVGTVATATEIGNVLRDRSTDSVVYRFYLREVTDSSGRVILRDSEEQRERFSGSSLQHDDRYIAHSDSAAGTKSAVHRTGYTLKEDRRTDKVTAEKKNTAVVWLWRGILFGCLLVALRVCYRQ